MSISFNINHHVRVKLTERGLSELEKQHESFRTILPKHGPFNPPPTDEAGFVSFQLWSLMERLGPFCSLGGSIPFETEILIDIPDYEAEVKRLTDENDEREIEYIEREAILSEQITALQIKNDSFWRQRKTLIAERNAMREQLDTIRNAVQPQENGPYYIDVEGAVAEILWNDTPQDKGSDV